MKRRKLIFFMLLLFGCLVFSQHYSINARDYDYTFYKETFPAQNVMLWVYKANNYLGGCWGWNNNALIIVSDDDKIADYFGNPEIVDDLGFGLTEETAYKYTVLPRKAGTYSFSYCLNSGSDWASSFFDMESKCWQCKKHGDYYHNISKAFEFFAYNLYFDIPYTLNLGEKKNINFSMELISQNSNYGEPGVFCEWVSSDDSIVKCDFDGTISGVRPGKATLSLKVNTEVMYTVDVTVPAPQYPTNIDLFCGERNIVLIEGVDPSIVTLSIKDESIAKLNGREVTGISSGSTSLIGTIGSISFECKVKVTANSISQKDLKVFSGTKETLWIKGLAPEKWNSSNPKVASVSNGIVTGLKPGETVITAEVGNQVLECRVTVPENTLSSTSLETIVGETISLYIINSNADLTYSSSDEKVVSAKNGNLMAMAPGKATISVKAGNDVLKCKVKVKKQPAPTGFSYEASSSIIKLNWDEYENAKSFSVYMYDSKKGKYTLIGSPKKPAYTIKDLDAGKTYVFKVAANVKINGTLMEQALSEKIKCKTEKKDKVGWQTIDGKKYYYKNGFAIGGGIQKIDGSKYIFDTDGTLITGKFTTIDGSKYYSESTGKIAVNKDVMDSENNITYVADSEGVLTKKKKASSTTKTSTKQITFNDVTIDIPTSWGSQYKDNDAINYYFGNYTVMIYTDPKSGSLTQSKADWLVDEFDECCCTALEITKSKKYTYENKKISAYYIYNLDLKIPNTSRTKSTACKGRLTAFEYNGKYYVAVIIVDKSSYNENSFDDYSEMVKSIKTVTKSSGGSGTKKTNTGKTSSTTVWVTEHGKSYHRIKNCGNGTYWEEDLETAKKRGLTPCGKCYK